MNNKLLKSAEIIGITIIIASLILMSIVSQDSHHIHSCTEEHCFTCTIIHIAQATINLIVTIFIYIGISFLIYFFLSRTHKKTLFFAQKSLVFQKVQMNN